MGKTALKYSAYLIGTYLLVYYATGGGRIIGETGKQTIGLVRAFQGR